MIDPVRLISGVMMKTVTDPKNNGTLSVPTGVTSVHLDHSGTGSMKSVKIDKNTIGGKITK